MAHMIAQINNLTDIIDVSIMDEKEKDAFIKNTFQRQINLAAANPNRMMGFGIFDFSKNINVDKLKQRLVGRLRVIEIIDIILKIGFECFEEKKNNQ